MSNYLSESLPIETGNVFFSPLPQVEGKKARRGSAVKILDTIANEQAKKRTHLAGGSVSGRPKLPKAKSKLSGNDLAILAEAYAKALLTMDKDINTQTQDFSQLQQLNQTESKIVLDSCKNALAQEANSAKMAKAVAKAAKQAADDQKVAKWLMIGVMIVVVLASVVGALFTGGASLLAAPEELEVLADTEVAADTTEAEVSTTSEGADKISLTDEADEESVGSTDWSTIKSPKGFDEINPYDESEKTFSELAKNDEENENSLTRFKQKVQKWAENNPRSLRWARRGCHMGATAGLSMPMLMEGIKDLEISNKRKDLSTAQAQVGVAISKWENNQMYFQFLQQLINRKGQVLEEEVRNASQIIDTYSSITQTYRQISLGLADAL